MFWKTQSVEEEPEQSQPKVHVSEVEITRPRVLSWAGEVEIQVWLHTGTEDELASPRKKQVGPERRESEGSGVIGQSGVTVKKVKPTGSVNKIRCLAC